MDHRFRDSEFVLMSFINQPEIRDFSNTQREFTLQKMLLKNLKKNNHNMQCVHYTIEKEENMILKF